MALKHTKRVISDTFEEPKSGCGTWIFLGLVFFFVVGTCSDRSDAKHAQTLRDQESQEKRDRLEKLIQQYQESRKTIERAERFLDATK